MTGVPSGWVAVGVQLAPLLVEMTISPLAVDVYKGGKVNGFGVTELDATDKAPVPTALVAVTRNVYATPFVNPVYTQIVLEIFEQAGGVATTGDDVTVYPVIAEPPVDAGAVQLTVASKEPATAVTPVGAPGTVTGVTELDAAEDGPAPFALIATTVNV